MNEDKLYLKKKKMKIVTALQCSIKEILFRHYT